MNRGGNGGGDPLEAIEVMSNLAEINAVYLSGGDGKGDETFWSNGTRRFEGKAIEALRLAEEPMNLWMISEFVQDRVSKEEVDSYKRLKRIAFAQEKIDQRKKKEALAELEEWVSANYFLQVIEKIWNKPMQGEDNKSKEAIRKYWLMRFPGIGERTSNILQESYMGMADPFLGRGILKDHFSAGLSEELLPEKIYQDNKIVICDWPVKEYGISGIYANIIYKTLFQKAMERREVSKEENPKLVGLFIDEWQTFCNPRTDAQFQATARSSWVATTYLTQNLEGVYTVMGSNMPKEKAKSLFGNLNLKYLCSNASYETNLWASEQIGKHLVDFENVNISKDMEISKTKNQHLHYKVPTDHFTMLKTGGKQNKYKVEAVVFKAGKTWGKDNQNYAVVEFDQRN
ncbi:MAG: TraM recognition domain-containing protein [Ekhidna sp.]|nr:TraM recognition domain-containing protein [Ekhidna sp.]